MIEKITRISNPLTIIAIFAALAEVASSAVLVGLPLEIQQTFVWFVMAFPLLLVLSFFITLNFNPRALYAPSDFENEDNFITLHERDKEFISKPDVNDKDRHNTDSKADNTVSEVKLYRVLMLAEQLLSPNQSGFSHAQKDQLQSALLEFSSSPELRNRNEFSELLEKITDLYAAAGLTKELTELDERYESEMTSKPGIIITMAQYFGRRLLGEEEFSANTYARFDKYARAAEENNLIEVSLPFRLVYEYSNNNLDKVEELIRWQDNLDESEKENMAKLLEQGREPSKLARKPRPDTLRMAKRVSEFLSKYSGRVGL